MTPGPIFLISGAPGAGKTTLALLLMQRYSFGLHIPVDDLREWVVSGLAQPLPTWTDETSRQFRLARQAAAQLARQYTRSGFAVAIDDVILPADASQHYQPYLQDCSLYKVLLLPALQVVLKRNRQRTNKTFDTQVLADTIRVLSAEFAGQVQYYPDWITIDTSDLNPTSAVDMILKKTTGQQVI